MGRGGYHGGSTVISGGGWSSFDPAARRRRKKAGPGEEGKQPEARKGTSRKPKREKPPASYAVQRLEYLGAVIDAALKAQPVPPLPRRARAELVDAVQAEGSVTAWAKAQPEFAATLQKKQRRLAVRHHVPQVRAANTVAGTSDAPQPRILGSSTAMDTVSRDALCAERAVLSIRIAEVESDIRRSRDRVAEIDRLLAALTKR